MDRLCLPLNIDSDTAFLVEPQDPVLLDAVPIPFECRCAFLPDQDAYRSACPDVVVADDIVSIVMSDGDAVPLAALDVVLLGERPLDPPAEKETLIVANHAVPPDHGTLRAGARVEAESRVIVAVAILPQHVVANLPAYAIAVVVTRRDFAISDRVAVLHPDKAGVVSVQISVVRFVAVERNIFDGDVRNVLAAEERE